MRWHERLGHRFVKYIPEQLEPGVLYISMEYATAVHSCCCGCGQEVVTPFTPTDWKMTFDGETVSLWPSIGNWKLSCRSHYIIRSGRVMRRAAWSEEEIVAEYQRDREAKARYYAAADLTGVVEATPPSTASPQDTTGPRSRIKALVSKLRRRA